jgi:hypothetical protein
MPYFVVNGWERNGQFDLGVFVDAKDSKREAVARAKRFVRGIRENGGGIMPVVIAHVAPGAEIPSVFRDGPHVKALWSNNPAHFEGVDRHHYHPMERIEL